MLFTLDCMLIYFVICLFNHFLRNILLIHPGLFLFDIYEGSTFFLLPNFKLRNFGQRIRVIVFSCKMTEDGLNMLWLFFTGSFDMLEWCMFISSFYLSWCNGCNGKLWMHLAMVMLVQHLLLDVPTKVFF